MKTAVVDATVYNNDEDNGEDLDIRIYADDTDVVINLGGIRVAIDADDLVGAIQFIGRD